MIVYHTSKIIVAHPDVQHSRNNLDFGCGFYVTKLKNQAAKYAEKFLLRNQSAVLNTYELSDDWIQYKIKRFDSYNEEWLDFIIANRKGLPVEKFDAVEGGVANDKIFRTLELYFNGDISKADALKQLIFEKINHQICFLNQEIITNCLTHISSEDL
ncbi:MAG: DUF3990 domain-containing protein [Bacteroidales bacterium]|nr:DUF3990 domain-containing protein [Bacteroidales bacterium]